MKSGLCAVHRCLEDREEIEEPFPEPDNATSLFSQLDRSSVPAVDAFWSISYYDQDGRMVEAPGPTVVSSQSNVLRYEPDGALCVHIGQRPPANKTENWLCSHDGPFSLNLRCYQPKTRMLEAQFELPAIERMEVSV